jgi:hypothetical protein
LRDGRRAYERWLNSIDTVQRVRQACGGCRPPASADLA